jgi:transaldolase
MKTKFLLDSGDINEYKQIQELAHAHNSEIWGSTTNPSLIAKKLAGKKVPQEEAFSVLQKEIIEEILAVVPGAVSAEVYAAPDTKADAMVEQGKVIATWDPRVVVKLPTTLEGFKARTELRKLGICINNTLVFSQQQVFAITLHEQIMTAQYGQPKSQYPCFISPFIGRLDDRGEDGISMLEHSVKTIHENFPQDLVWMLEASIRTVTHLQKGIALDVELATAPAKVYTEWFSMTDKEKSTAQTSPSSLTEIPYWQPTPELVGIKTIDDCMHAIENGALDITHPLTDKGIEKFIADWSAIIA